jgi:hypothetical protein
MIFNDPDWFLNIDINKKFILEREKKEEQRNSKSLDYLSFLISRY